MLRLRPNSRAYLPRMPPVKSYSGSMSSPLSRTIWLFLIGFSFAARCWASADDPNCCVTVEMNDHEQSKLIRHADGNETILFRRMRGVRNRAVRPVAEDFGRLDEGHPHASGGWKQPWRRPNQTLASHQVLMHQRPR